MQYVGNTEVLANFLRKQLAIERGEKSRIRPAIVVLGGGMSGVVSAGMLKALHEVAPQAPHVCAGVSAGSGNLYGFLAGVPDLTLKVYEHLATSGFVTGPWWRMRMEIDLVCRILRTGFEDIIPDQNDIIMHRSEFVVFATEYSTGLGLAIDAKKAEPDIVEAVRASMMAPGICSGTVHIGGKEYVDGACGMPFPVRTIARTYRPTDVLILFNQPLPEKMGWVEWLLFPIFARVILLLHGVSRPVRDRTAAMDKVMAYEIRMLKRERGSAWWPWRAQPKPRQHIRWIMIAPDASETVSQRSADKVAIKRAGELAYANTVRLISVVRERFKI
ncbi:MAG: patatin-like phospholipase family protein [Patescibacteria group bacterium]